MQKFTKEQREWLEQHILVMLNRTIEHCYAKDKEEDKRFNKEITELWSEFYSNCEFL